MIDSTNSLGEPELQDTTHLFNNSRLYQQLNDRRLSGFAETIQRICRERLFPQKHGNLRRWTQAWQQLPDVPDALLDASDDVVRVSGTPLLDAGQALKQTLQLFHPWRKGPLQLFGISIDTEWRSNLKWQRLSQAIDFRGKSILDVGCGNGYYGWKMLDAGADFVLGCDPFLLYLMQFEVFRKYASKPERHFVIPLADNDLPAKLQAFDLTFSMGVLYHRSSPIEHLQALAETLKPDGTLVLETLIIESPDAQVLVPEGRYAKMRNVWFLPSIAMLSRWLRRTGFTEIDLIDVSKTTSKEQRSTPWMTFESLQDFLDPENDTLTIEGYPAPVRAIVSAKRRTSGA